MIEELEKKILEENERLINIEDEKILFEKDKEGNTLLDFILKHNMNITSSTEKKLSHNPYAYLIYLRNNKLLYNFHLTEDELFTIVEDNKPLIYIIFETNKSYEVDVDKIENHKEIVDIILNYNTSKLNKLNKKIIDYLLTKENDTYNLEKYINHQNFTRLVEVINNGKILYEIYLKTGKKEILKNINSTTLLEEIAPGKMLLDVIEEENIKSNNLIYLTEYQDKKFIDYAIKNKKYKYFLLFDPQIFSNKTDNDITLLEQLIKDNISEIPKIEVNNEELFKILYKYNRLDLIKKISKEELLMTNMKQLGLKEDLDIYTYLKNKNIDFGNISWTNKKEFIKFLCDKKEYAYLSHISSEEMLEEYTKDKILFEEILENTNINSLPGLLRNRIELLPILLKHNRYDLLSEVNIEHLLSKADDNKTYFDLILDNIKEEKKQVLLENIFSSTNTKFIAKAYIILAHHDMLEYAKELTEEELLDSNDKKLLYNLLTIDPILTLDKIISKRVQSNQNVAAYIKQYGYEVKDINLGEENESYKEELSKKYNYYGVGPLLKEDFELIDTLKELFLNDNKSDKKLVNALVIAYIQGLIENPSIIRQELKNLIAIKQNKQDRFCILSSDNGSYFSPFDESIYIESTNIITIMHENGHAMHHFLDNTSFPDNYFEIIKKAANNKEILKKTEIFSNEYISIRDSIKKSATLSAEKYFQDYYTVDKIKEIEDYLQKGREERKEKLLELGISKDKLDILLDEILTIDEYKKHQKKVYIDEYIEQIIRTRYADLMAISDIIDAIYRGELFSKVLTNDKGEKLKGAAGHGIYYYYDDAHGFNEMVANFAAIIKIPNSKEALNKLRYYVGDEIFDMISSYYYNTIVSSKEKEQMKGSR